MEVHWADGSVTSDELEGTKLAELIMGIERFTMKASLKMFPSFINAAWFLGINRNTFSHKMKKYKLKRKNNASTAG